MIPNEDGRVLDASGAPLPGLYTTGWIKRGPVGLIGHTKSDALETVTRLLEDIGPATQPERPEEDAILALLDERGIRFTTWAGWLALDAHERALGAADPSPVLRERVKVVPRDEQVGIARHDSLVST